MADGVQLNQVRVTSQTGDEVTLVIDITIKCESELDAIGWLVSKLED